MRVPFPALLLTAITCSAPAAAADRNFGITSFDRVRIDGPFVVTLSTGVAPFARASGSSAALDAVAIEVQGRTLVVHASRSSWGGYPGQVSGPVTIALGTHDLNAAWLNGSGSLAIDKARGLSFDLAVQGSGAATIGRAEIDQLKLTLAGTAVARISGTAAQLSADVRGVSALAGGALSVKNATVIADGPTTVELTVTDSIKITARGATTVRLGGSPACTAKLAGSASVSGCR